MIVQFQPQPVRLRFSVDEYYQMTELGLLKDYEKAEIIEGELIRKTIVGDRHAFIVDILTKFFVKNTSDKIRVRIQNPVRLSDFNEPEPDIALADLTKFDGKRHPRPEEILLLIEVSDSTVKYDRDIKLPLYAGAEIPEVWLVNLPNEIIEVHTKPQYGLYQLTEIYQAGEIIKSKAVSGIQVEASKILGE